MDAGEYRHAEEHTQHAAEAAADKDGDDDPEARNADGLAQNFGAEDVAVELLEGNNENDKVEALAGAHEQDQKRAGDRAEEGTEDGDDVRHAHKDRDDGRVGELQNRADDEAQNADDERVEQLAAHKAGEDAVGLAGGAQRALIVRRGDERVEQLARVEAEGLLAGEDVNGNDDAHEQVLGKDQHAQHAAGHGDDGDLRAGNDGVLHPVDQLVVVITDQREHALGDVGIVLHKLRDPGVDGAVIALEIGKEQRYARDQLGDQDAEEQIHESQRKEPGHKDAQAAHQSGTLDAEPVAEETVEKVHDGREQVGHRKTVEHGLEDAEELFYKNKQHAVLKEGVVKHENGAGRGGNGHAPAKIGFLLHVSSLALGRHSACPYSE